MISEAHLQSACCDLVADVARLSGKVQLKVAGTSMVPALWPGDLVTVRNCQPSELAPDSIVVFRQNQRLVVHRMLRREAGRIVTRGDARPCLDPPVPADQIIGCVEAATRNGRPVRLRPWPWQTSVAWLLRRSAWATSFYLRLISRFRRFSVAGPVLGL